MARLVVGWVGWLVLVILVCGVGGWCCASVLSFCGVGWIASGCELVYGVVLYAGVAWVGFGLGVIVAASSLTMTLFGLLMIVLMG